MEKMREIKEKEGVRTTWIKAHTERQEEEYELSKKADEKATEAKDEKGKRRKEKKKAWWRGKEKKTWEDKDDIMVLRGERGGEEEFEVEVKVEKGAT